jgi:ankyrin repeat protein
MVLLRIRRKNMDFKDILDAAKTGKVEDIQYFINEIGDNIEARSITNATPLVVACDWGNEEVIQYLVSKGANVNACTEDGITSLQQAASRCSLQVVKLLVEHGADVNAKRKDSEFKNLTPLHRAAESNNDVEVLKYLISQGAKVNAKARTGGFLGLFGRTPLQIADTEEKKRILRDAMQHK